MKTYINGQVYKNGVFQILNIIEDNGIIIEIGKNIKGEVVDCKNLIIAPAFIDPHVHLREPGYEYKETIATGTKAAAKGGYTKIFLMPNVNPTPDSLQNLKYIQNIINNDSQIDCYQLATITKGRLGEGELAEIEELLPEVIGFSDDGTGVTPSNLMYEACLKVANTNKVIIAHAEDKDLLYGGYIHAGSYAHANNHKGIISISETCQVARDLVIAQATYARYHLCHVSTKETIELIRYYKSIGTKVTVEVTPHNLTLNDSMLQDNGAFKMNPPLRSNEDQDALIKALQDGTIDCIATDHAPHSIEEKSKGLEGSSFGISGIEIAFSVLYTKLVKSKIISLEKLLDLMSKNISNIFPIESNQIAINNKCNIVVLDLNKEFIIDGAQFLSKGKITPFDKMNCIGKVVKTIYNGKVVYDEL